VYAVKNVNQVNYPGVQIGEMDIADLVRMKAETNKSDIIRVMTNLLDGSYNHLTAFETQIGYITQ